MYKFLKKDERLSIIAIFVFLIVITALNMSLMKKNERDTIRNSHLGNLSMALGKFYLDHNYYPQSDNDGSILACEDENTKPMTDIQGKSVHVNDAKLPKFTGLIACRWGEDSLYNLLDESYPHYINPLPQDPLASEGRKYVYQSDGDTYQIYVSYEGKSTIDYRKSIKDKKILCGNVFCNAGRTVGGVILE